MPDLPVTLAGPQDFPEVASFCGAWLSAPTPYFAARLAHDPAQRRDRVLVVRDGGRLVSTTHLFDLTLSFGEAAVRCAGIGNVCTHEAWRGRGLARSLLLEAHRLAAADGYPLTMLFTGHHRFYEAVGYRTWRRPEIRFTGMRPPREAARSVRRIDFIRDRAALAEIHSGYAARIPGMAMRPPGAWERQDEWTGMHPAEDFALALLAGGRAYARAHAWWGPVRVLEFGAAAGAERETAGLAGELARLGAARGDAVCVPAACGELAGALRPYAVSAESQEDCGIMFRVTDAGGLERASGGAWKAGKETPPSGSHFWDTDGF